MLLIKISVPAVVLLTTVAAFSGERLYNGIELPDEWPPRIEQLPAQLPQPPYLKQPPDVIPIDVGRQLFVDDFLIEETDLTRRFHKPVYHPANPVLTYDKPWEMSKGTGGLPTACPYSGGVWYDPQRKKFRMWYMGGYIEHLCLAESDDGIHWTKPQLDVRPGTNIVLWRGATESNSLLMDLAEPDPMKRFKYFLTNIGKGWKTEYRTSADGVHWSDPHWLSGPHGDRTTVFYNPFRKRWVFGLRTGDRSAARLGRSKKYWETPDINDAATVQWPPSEPGRFDAQAKLWVTADRGLDHVRHEIGVAPQLYHLDCVAYESLVLGMFNILRGDFHENDSEGRDAFPGRPKCAEVCLGYSRDGFHWHRPTHDTFAGISERRGDWNWGNVQSAGNSFLVVGDYLYFYVSGRRGAPKFVEQNTAVLNAAYAGCSTGLAILRRDGFASMDADANSNEPKTLTTRKVQFTGSRLFVNADARQGELRVEVLDASGQVISPFTKENCIPVRSNETLETVTWRGGEDLSALANQPVRFRFYLTKGRLYSFWVSGSSGASGGYVAGGGPGFQSSRDTVGSAILATNQPPVADAGDDLTVRDTDGNGTHRVTLNGTGSIDNDSRSVSFRWLLHGKQIATGVEPTLDLPAGNHTVVLAVKDDDEAESHAQVSVTILPQTDPVPSPDGLVMWLRADSLTEVDDGSPIAGWGDSSGNGMNTAQADPKRQPVYVAKGIGDAPAVRFDGVDDHLVVDECPGLLFTFHKSTIIAVVRPETGGTIISQAHANLHVTPNSDGRLGYGSSHPIPGGRLAWPQIHSTKGGSLPVGRGAICAMRHANDIAGGTALFVNGRRDDDGTAFPYHRTSAIRPFVGCAYRERSPWKGNIAEILVYSRALPDQERVAIERYLANKYDIGQ